MNLQRYIVSESPLNELECLFKDLSMQFPERNLHLPHTLEYSTDILSKASLQTDDRFPRMLLENELEESLFFQSGLDVEIYKHLRYLPATWHSHSFFEIACVVNGSCTNYIMEQEFHMVKGDICIIAPGTRHAISAFSDDCLIFNLLLRTSTFENAFFGILSENDILSDFFMRTLYHSKTHPYLYFRTGSDIEAAEFVEHAHHEFHLNRQYKNRMLVSIVHAFFITLLRNHGSNVIIPTIDTQGNDENVIFILKYIQEHYTTVTLKELADFFNYSERQLQRIIKASTGMSFSDNIQKLKMDQAVHLLKNPDLSIGTIAEELGYADSGAFRYNFKKVYGMTPVEYREKC